jgi:hypothetical protein
MLRSREKLGPAFSDFGSLARSQPNLPARRSGSFCRVLRNGASLYGETPRSLWIALERASFAHQSPGRIHLPHPFIAAGEQYRTSAFIQKL